MLTLNGQTYTVPGTYSILQIIQAGGSALPIFNVGVIIGATPSGIPYTVGTGNTPVDASKFILPFTNTTDLAANCGLEGDASAVTFAKYAKSGGAGKFFFINAQPVTKMTGGTVANATPATAFTVASKNYGAPVNDTSLTIAASVHTIIPPKLTTLLTADSGTGKTIFVGDTTPFKVGQTVLLNSNGYAAPVSKVIESVNSTTKEITFTAAIATSALKSDYARIFVEDTDNQEVSTALTTRAQVTAFYQASKYLSAALADGITLMPVTLAKAYIQNLPSATKATSPAATATDWQAVCDNFIRWNNEFAVTYKVYMRILGITTSDTANHAAFRDLAIASAAQNKPLAVVAGCALGDYLLSDTSEPKTRALALNSDRFQLAGFGGDGLGANISYAPYLFGLRLANNVNHNQTGDGLPFATVEKAYDKFDTTLAAYNANGVMTFMATKNGYQVTQGLTTYQDQSTTFNPDTKKTYLVANRDTADFFQRAVIELMEQLNGTDGVTKEVIASKLNVLANQLIDLGMITSHTIDAITKSGNAWTVEDTATLESPTDFIGIKSTLIVN